MTTDTITPAAAPVKCIAGKAVLPCAKDESPAYRLLRLRLQAYCDGLSARRDQGEPFTCWWVGSASRPGLEQKLERADAYSPWACGCEFGGKVTGRVCTHVARVTPVQKALCPCCQSASAWIYTEAGSGAVLCPACLFRAELTRDEAYTVAESVVLHRALSLTALLLNVWARLTAPVVADLDTLPLAVTTMQERAALARRAMAELYGVGV